MFAALLLAAPNADVALEPARDALRRHDFVRAESVLKPLAASGNAEAAYQLGILYLPRTNDIGLPAAPAEACRLLTSAANQSHPKAAYALAAQVQAGTCAVTGKSAEEWRSLATARGYGVKDAAPTLASAPAADPLTLLKRAARDGDMSSLERLLGQVSASAVSADRRTALHEAADGQQASAARVLLEHGAAVDARDAAGDTPLHLAARRGAAPVIEVLLRAKASPNGADARGGTPLMLAVAADGKAAVELLLQHGADVQSRNAQGLSALDLADRAGPAPIAKEIAGLLQLLNPATGWLGSAALKTKSELENALRGAGASINQAGADGSHSAVFLAMGRDHANGRITLAPLTNALWVEWDVASNLPLYDAETGISVDIANALGGKAAFNPFWQRLRQPASVHNLGGCVMADDAAHGVTDANGEVFGYRGLYVFDGGILPSATGVNPSHTIAAVAERNVEAAIRRLKGDAVWRAPEATQAQPVIDPLSQLTIPAEGTMAPTTQTIGLGFTETMKGFLDRGHNPPDDYAGAERAGQRNNSYVDFTLTITFSDLDASLADKAHAGIANGMVHVDGFTGPNGAPVTGGVFNLFVDAGEFEERKMLYALPFSGADGKPYLLDGFKDVKDHGRFDVWGATSTLYTVIRAGHERTGAVMATGIMHILMQDFMHQLTTFQVSGTNDPAKKASAIARFGHMFMGTLWDVFAAPRLPK